MISKVTRRPPAGNDDGENDGEDDDADDDGDDSAVDGDDNDDSGSNRSETTAWKQRPSNAICLFGTGAETNARRGSGG